MVPSVHYTRCQLMGSAGRAALQCVIDYCRRQPGASELLTSSNEGEGSPLGFYERCGFVKTGEVEEEIVDGVVDRELVLRYRFDAPAPLDAPVLADDTTSRCNA